jgi:hypothetical protein
LFVWILNTQLTSVSPQERQQRRKNIAVEFLVTETTYVEGLSTMIKVCSCLLFCLSSQ